MAILDSIVVGAGQAGLGVSYFLQRKGFDHLVFEKERIGESWLTQRWDSFQLNTPNLFNTLPGLAYNGTEPDGFWHTKDLIDYLQQYAKHFQLPVRTGVNVVSVNRAHNNEGFVIQIKNQDQAEELIESRSVVVASGIQRIPKYPAIRSRLPENIFQLHTVDYRNPQSLPPGAVVVVGSGQSGCQIAEDLLSAERTVYLCTSKVPRVPRRYRGRDIVAWWAETMFWDVTYESLQDKSMSRISQPQISGIGRYGHTVSLQYLAGRGAEILGRLLDIDSGTLSLGDDAAAHVAFADGFSKRIKDDIDNYIENKNVTPRPPLEDDSADIPDPEAKCVSALRRLNLINANVSTVIWATGFTGDFSWLHLPVIDDHSKPNHNRGVSSERGLYFLGFPWLHSRKSGILYGIAEDAEYIASTMEKQLR